MLNWQKSSYSSEASSCIYLATAPDGTSRLRESDAPDAILTTTPAVLRTFIRGVQTGEFNDVADRG